MPLSRILLAYDITQPKRAARARKTVRGFVGDLQKSVFTGLATPARQMELLSAVERFAEEPDDWLLLQIDRRAKVISLGVTQPHDDALDYWG